MDLGGFFTPLKGEQMLQATLGVAQGVVRGIEISKARLSGFLFSGIGEFVRMRLGALGEEFSLQHLDVKPRLARFIEQRKGVSHS